MTKYSYQIEMRDNRDNPIGRGRWIPIASVDGFPDWTPADWATELANLVRHENRNVEYRLVYVKRGK